MPEPEPEFDSAILTPAQSRRLEIDSLHADVCASGVGLTAPERVFLLVIGGLLRCGCAVSEGDEARLREIAERRL